MFYAKNENGEQLPTPLPFGTLLGVAKPGVPAFSSDYESCNRSHQVAGFRASHNGVYTGYKYQCVEYARRFLVTAYSVTFQDVHMAYHIFELKSFLRVTDGARLPIIRCENGANTAKQPELRPKHGSVLIWREGGFFRHTGHVGIVTEATDSYVRVAEQNVTDATWPGDYARQLPVSLGSDGSYTIHETYRRSQVLGWLNLPDALVAELEATQRDRPPPHATAEPASLDSDEEYEEDDESDAAASD
jgi:glutathionylspermidine amidase/synthetase